MVEPGRTNVSFGWFSPESFLQCLLKDLISVELQFVRTTSYGRKGWINSFKVDS
jgi:hypothetical protein